MKCSLNFVFRLNYCVLRMVMYCNFTTKTPKLEVAFETQLLSKAGNFVFWVIQPNRFTFLSSIKPYLLRSVDVVALCVFHTVLFIVVHSRSFAVSTLLVLKDLVHYFKFAF